MALEDLFKPASVSEQLSYGLSMIGLEMPDYRKNSMPVINELVRKGFVLRPYLASGRYGARCGELVELSSDMREEQRLIIPYDADILPTGPKARLSKKGNLLNVERYYPKKEQISCEERVKAALKTVSLEDVLVSCDFEGVRNDRRYRVLMLLDCVREAIAYDTLSEKDFEVTVYSDAEQVLRLGCRADVTVPSFSSDGKSYNFKLLAIPVYRGEAPDEEVIKTSFCIDNTDNCGKADFFKIKYGRHSAGIKADRTGEEVLFDHHAILGYKLAKRKLEEKGFSVIDPFPAPSDETRKFFWKLNRQVMFEVLEDRQIRRYPLGEVKVFMEIMLHKLVGYRNLKQAQTSQT